ncbi:MAG: ArsR/SmtB family transcription factor [Candidatus Bathyarchaeia archaeon]
MKPIKTLSNPEAFKVTADESRRRILYLLRAKEMTVSQIADELDLTPQTVYHHIKKLCEVDMVEVTREVRVDHLIESYYRATAEVFHLTVGKETGGKETMTEGIKSALEALKKVGFKLKYDEKDVTKLAELSMQLEDCCGDKDVEEAISKLEDVDHFAKQDVREYAGLLKMTDEELARQDEIKKKFRKTLKSLMVK